MGGGEGGVAPQADVVDDGRSDSATGPTGRASRLPFWVHAALLALLLLAAVPVFDSEAPAFADEGLYSAQAAALADGSWSVARPAPELDLDGRSVALIDAIIIGDRAVPYARKVAYPLVLTPFYAAGGSAGLLVASVMGTWAAAVTAGLLAGRISRRLAVPSMWLLGIGSPLLFNAYIVQGHSIAAGLAGAVLVGSAAILDDGSRRWILPTLVAAAALVGVRSEGTIFVLALCLSLVTQAAWQWWPNRRSPGALPRAHIGLAFLLGAVGAAVFWLNDVAAKRISDGGLNRTGSVVERPDPINAVWTDLLRPWFVDGSNASAMAVLLIVSVVAAAVALRVRPSLSILPIGLLLVAAVAAVLRQFEPRLLVSGLLPAFPAAAALVLLRRDDLRHPVVARLVLVSLATTIGLTLTVYGDIEGNQWGGRFFQVMLPALVPLVVLGMDRARSLLSPTEAKVSLAALLVVTMSLSAFSLRLNLENRDRSSDLVRTTFETADSLGIKEPLVAVAEFQPTGVGRLFWRRWMDGEAVVQPNLSLLRLTLQASRDNGIDRVLVVSDADGESFEFVLGDAIEAEGWTLEGADDSNAVYSVLILRDREPAES